MPERPGSSPDAEERLRALARRLEGRAEAYYPGTGAGRWRAVLHAHHRRPSAHLYEYELIPERGERRRIVVKLPERRGLLGTGSHRPRLFPVGEQPSEPTLEFTAMRAIEAAVHDAADPRLGAVRALDLLEDIGAVVLEHVDAPTLASILRRSAWHLPRRPHSRLGRLFENVGVWQRVYRQTASVAEPRRGNLPEVSATVYRYVEYLAGCGVRPELVRDLPTRFDARADRTLPGELRLGSAHTDLSPRNVFVATDGSVRIFDTLGCWRVPQIEDPAYFLTSIQTAGLQLASRGLAGWWVGVGSLEERFLRGAGLEGPSQREAMSTYRVLLLLDKWAALRERSRRADARAHRFDEFLAASVGRSLESPLPG